MVVLGLPLFFLELSLGQYAGVGPARLFSRLSCPGLGGLGWGMVLTMVV